jgi:hypothetical protein
LDNTGGWVTWGDWNGDGYPEILVNRKTAEDGAGFQVWTGTGECLYAFNGLGSVPLGIETGGHGFIDLDGDNKADVLVSDDRGVYLAGRYVILMEAP